LIFKDFDIVDRRRGYWDLGSSFGKFINGFHFEEFVLVGIAFEIKVI
jgi:hypothetical protein